MTPERWQQVCSVFNAALKAPAGGRDALIRGACADDEALRAEVERLLNHDARATRDDFLGVPELTASYAPPPAEVIGSRIGPYKVLQKIGEGGMGAVYVADQEQPVRRRVALKLIQPGMDDAQVVARFEAERQALALMDHPNIAKVLDAGWTDSGRPYFVMELVRGVPITRYCDDARLTTRERLELFIAVCQAVQHAHQKGVIHRDLKPSNILVTTVDDRHAPKVIDFGVAKAVGPRLTEETIFTQFGALVGTLEYMSPEQAGLSALDVDTRGDVYSLGVLLYELLTGTTPLDRDRLRRAAYEEVLKRIKEEEPPRPSTRLSDSSARLKTIAASRGTEPERLMRAVRGDLDWVVMKALEKDRTRRYETASAFARDVRRHLDGDPVEAGPPSAWYRLRKLATKHRAALAVSGAFAVLLVAAAAVSTGLAIRANKAREQSARSETKAIDALKKAVAEAERANEATRLAEASERIAKAQARVSTSLRLAALSASERTNGLDRSLLLAVEALRTENTLESRGSLFKALCDRPGLRTFLHASGGGVNSMAFSPDGKTLAALDGGRLAMWDVATRRRLWDEPLSLTEGGVNSVTFSPDGKALAAGYGRNVSGGGVLLWDVAARKCLWNDPLPESEGNVWDVAFSPDGKTLAAGCGASRDGGASRVVLWDVAARKRASNNLLPAREGGVRGVRFSPDGKTLAAGYPRGVVLWDVAARTRRADIPLTLAKGVVVGVAFSPDGKALAAAYSYGGPGDGFGGVVLWDVAGPSRLSGETLPVNEGIVVGVAFSPDGKALAAACFRGIGVGEVVTWDVAGQRRLSDDPLPVNEGSVRGVAFSPDGKALAAAYGGGGGGIVLWDRPARSRLSDDPLIVDEGSVRSVAFGPDGKALAAAYSRGGDGVDVVLWDVAGRRRLSDETLRVSEGNVVGVAFSPDGKILAAVAERRVVLWDVAGRRRLSDELLPVNEGRIWGVAFSPDGKTLAAVAGRGVVLWDMAARSRLTDVPLAVNEGSVTNMAFSPDGKTLATAYSRGGGGGGGGGLVLWDVATRRRLPDVPLIMKEGSVTGVAFSPDGKTIAAGHNRATGSVVLWDVAGRSRLSDEPLPVSEGHVVGVAFSPDGKALAVAYSKFNKNASGVVLWDVDLESWQRIAGRIANRNLTREEWRRFFPDEPYRRTFAELPDPPEISSQVGERPR